MYCKKICKIDVETAISGEEAILLCENRIRHNQEMYRLIVMDINMPPGIDGVETTAKIRAIADSYVKAQKKSYLIVAHTALP
jgi:CheY-like chemotaxis protein